MKDPLLLEFDSLAYSLSAIQKSCLRFTKIASFEIQQITHKERTVILVAVSPFSNHSNDELEDLGKLIRNEVLDQHLREKIREQTEGVRNLILAHAFSKTGLIASPQTKHQILGQS